MSFEKVSAELFVIYKLQDVLSPKLAQEMAADILAEAKNSQSLLAIVVDLQEYELDYRAFKILGSLGLELVKLKKKIYALSERSVVHLSIKQEGLDRLIKPIRKISEIALSSPAPKQASADKSAAKLDVNFVNPFIDGTIHVLDISCKTRVTPQKPILKIGHEFHCPIDIAGLITVKSPNFKGSIAICFPASVFLGLMSKMFDEEMTELSDDLKDGAAELANMIFGHAKRVLNEQGHSLEKAIPTVVSGPGMKIEHPGSKETIILPFTVGESQFFMEIGTEQYS